MANDEIRIYAFEHSDGSEYTDWTTLSAREADDFARENKCRVVAISYVFSDLEPTDWNYCERCDVCNEYTDLYNECPNAPHKTCEDCGKILKDEDSTTYDNDMVVCEDCDLGRSEDGQYPYDQTETDEHDLLSTDLDSDPHEAERDDGP